MKSDSDKAGVIGPPTTPRQVERALGFGFAQMAYDLQGNLLGTMNVTFYCDIEGTTIAALNGASDAIVFDDTVGGFPVQAVVTNLPEPYTFTTTSGSGVLIALLLWRLRRYTSSK